MSMSDPLGDMLTRIRNGQKARHPTIACPHSNVREAVCRVLQDEGYIRGFKVEAKKYWLSSLNMMKGNQPFVN